MSWFSATMSAFATLGNLTDEHKVAQKIRLLTDWALTWATIIWETGGESATKF